MSFSHSQERHIEHIVDSRILHQHDRELVSARRLSTILIKDMVPPTVNSYLDHHLSDKMSSKMPMVFDESMRNSDWVKKIRMVSDEATKKSIVRIQKNLEHEGREVAKKLLDEGESGFLYQGAMEKTEKLCEGRINILQGNVTSEMTKLQKSYDAKISEINTLKKSLDSAHFNHAVTTVIGGVSLITLGVKMFFMK